MSLIGHFKKHSVFYFIFLAGLALRLYFFSGFVGYDDKYYILQSFTYAEGIFETAAHQFGPRIGANFVGALIVSIFGANAFSFALFPLLCSLLNIALAYRIALLLFENESTALFSAAIMAILPFEIIYASLFYIDLSLGTILGLSVYLFLRGEAEEKWIWYLLAGLVFGWAYLIKSVAIFVVPVMGLYVLVKRQFKVAYLAVVLGVAIIGFSELLFHAVNSDDMMFRRNILSERSTGIIEMKEQDWEGYVADKVTSPIQTGNFYVDRLLIEPVLTVFGRPEFGLFFYMVLPAFLYFLWRRDSAVTVLLIWFGWVFGYILWGTINPKSYIPLATLFVSARYFTIVFLPGAILAGKFISDLNIGSRWKYGVLGCSLLVSLFCTGYDATRYDKHFAETSYDLFQSNKDARWIVDPNDYVGFLYFSNFNVGGNVELLYPNGNRDSKTLKSLFILQPNITGYDSLGGQHGVFVAVEERFVKDIENKQVVAVVEDQKQRFRNSMLGTFLDPLGFDLAHRDVSTRNIYYIE